VKYAYKIIYNKTRDVVNWYDACNSSIVHGVNWSSSIPAELLGQLHGVSEETALSIISEYLDKRYVDDQAEIDNFISSLLNSYKSKFEVACRKLEDAMGKPTYIDCFTTYVTTVPLGAYNHKEGYMFDYVEWTDPISGVLHELSHMIFTHYWRDNPNSNVSTLTEDQFEWLKESLTVILDEDFLPIIERVDRGYDIHQSFRKELHKYWKKNHDFAKLVKFGQALLPNYIN
jgi:hypothetical protein